MAFPKGTFLIRYCDLETLECDQIWCVDNHHMLLKYRLTSHIEGKRRLYLKSQPERYVGWKCEEPWHFHELTVLERDRDGSRVLILYPDAKELAECREKAKRQKHLAEEMKHGLGTSRNSGDINQNFDEMRSNTSGMLMVLKHILDTEEQRLHEQQNMEIQMVDEAAKAIERFILVADSHSAEMDDEQMAEVVDDENSTEEQMIIEEDDN
uniref:Transcription initiation factor TFIID subunit 7 n=1 Tax=Elaeophora elaphi TaxID=1147741 RepID=A0A0R3S678_9BILA